ncbi:MAG: hypothetical protein MK105_09100 [Crocinitomicaceae bacterium]|nr:hypothetical protein [Crocinitomicaceae bacterium]
MRLILIFSLILVGLPVFAQVQESEKNSANKPDSIQELKGQNVYKESVKKKKGGALKKKNKNHRYGSFDVKEAQETEEDQKRDAQSVYKTVESNFNINEVKSNTQRTQRTPSASQQTEMDNAVDYFENTSPSSFEYNYFNYSAGNHDISREQNLVVAEGLRPSNSDVHVQKAALHIIKNETAEAIKYIDKLIVSKRLSSSALEYGKDLLRSVRPNGILITHGFDDNYSAWYAQHKLGIRQDVVIVSLDFMQSDYYRTQLKNKGYLIPKNKVVDVDFFTSFCNLNKDKGVSVSLTIPKEYFSKVLPRLFVTGLVFEYHSNDFNNFSRNDDLWKNVLSMQIVLKAKDEKAKQLSSNYLPMLFQLRRVYNQKGDSKTVQLLDKEIDQVGAQCRKFDKVQKLKGAY